MKTLQIRNVPDQVHNQLKSRAALEGRSLSDYALGELRRTLDRPTRQELLERIASRSRVDADETSVDAVRSGRDRP